MKYLWLAFLLALSFVKIAVAEDSSSYFQKGITYEEQNKFLQAKEQFQLAYEHGLSLNLLTDRIQLYGLSVKEETSQIRKELIDTHIPICMPINTSEDAFHHQLQTALTKLDAFVKPSIEQETTALYVAYPCPFSPERDELKPAIQKDIEGAWLFPESSQKLRLNLNSVAFRTNPIPSKCDAVVYYPDGEMRAAEIKEKVSLIALTCPFINTKNIYSLLPSGQKIVHWALLGEGRVQITRTDVKDYVEEWNIYVVQKDFEFAGVKFKRGDLAAYERPAIKITGNHSYQEVISPIFRHLQRLPD